MKTNQRMVFWVGWAILFFVGCSSMEITTVVSPDYPRDNEQSSLIRLTLSGDPEPTAAAETNDLKSATTSDIDDAQQIVPR